MMVMKDLQMHDCTHTIRIFSLKIPHSHAHTVTAEGDDHSNKMTIGK